MPGNDTITISFGDPDACTPPCSYIVGVTGWTSTAVYSLVASLGGTIIHLIDGQAEFGYIAPHVLSLFEFDLGAQGPSTVDVTVEVVPFQGSLEVYTTQAVDSNMHSVLPSIVCSAPQPGGGASLVLVGVLVVVWL